MIESRIIELICEQFGLDKGAVSLSTNFVDDLEADSLDIVELAANIEDEFALGEIGEEELIGIRTVQDLVDYVSAKTGK